MNCRSILFFGCIFVMAGLSILGVSCYVIIDQYGWKGILGILSFVLVVYIAYKKFLGSFLMIPFILKGNALKGASIQFTKIKFMGQSKREEYEESDAPLKNDYEVEFKITPKKENRFYDVGELLIVNEDAKISMNEDPTDNDIGNFTELFIKDGDKWERDFDKVIGTQEFKGVMKSEPKASIKVQYYFYYIGVATLPKISD